LETAYNKLTSTFGFHYSFERFSLDDDREGLGWRISTEYEKAFAQNRVSMSANNYLTGSLEPTNDIESKLTLGVRYSLTRSLIPVPT
jgi:hypothetical protein